MPRFFFHIRDGSELIPDETGSESADLSEAVEQGVQLAKGMVGDLREVGDVVDGQTIEVADSSGAVLHIIEVTGHVPDVREDA